MASNEQSVTKLRQNKRALVEAFNSVGFGLTEDARAADFPDLLRWGAGLLDITVDAVRREDNRKFYFTKDEWLSLSATEQGRFLLRGLRVRADGLSFTIAPDTITNKTWGSNKACPDLHPFATKYDVYSFTDARTETERIVQSYEGTAAGAPAAEAALAYKAFTEERDGAEDTSEWCLPAVTHLMVMVKYMHEINDVLTAVWSRDFNISMQRHWSCCKWSNSEAYSIRLDESGRCIYEAVTNVGVVRPICLD